MAIGDRRKIRKSKTRKPKKIRSRKPSKGKYVSTQYTLTDDPKADFGSVTVEGHRTEAQMPSEPVENEDNKKEDGVWKQRVKNFLIDGIGKKYRLKDTWRDRPVEEQTGGSENDGTFESTNYSTGKDQTDDKSKKYPSKKTGTKVNEVYKLRKWGVNEETGKDMFDIDIRRRVTQHNPANQVYQSREDEAAQDDHFDKRVTEHDYARTMDVEKFRGKGGAYGFDDKRQKLFGKGHKRKKYKLKQYVDKGDMGGTRTFELEGGNYSVDNPQAGNYKQVGSTKVTKKEMRQKGYKPISTKRFNRIANRQSQYKDNQMTMGMDQAAGGLTGTEQSYDSGQKGKRNFAEGIDRLFHGQWNREDRFKRNK